MLRSSSIRLARSPGPPQAEVALALTVEGVYIPEPFETADPTENLALLRRAGFGHLVVAGDGGIVSSSLPFLVDSELPTVRAHLARANPHWQHMDAAAALLIVSVTDAYVSPSWYPSKATTAEVVPTWNYEVVQVRGVVTIHHDRAWLEQVVRDLTEHHEVGVEGDSPPWSLDDAPRPFVERMLDAIVGLELEITDIEAKRKLSQNRPEHDRLAVVDALLGSVVPRRRATGQAMAGPGEHTRS